MDEPNWKEKGTQRDIIVSAVVTKRKLKVKILTCGELEESNHHGLHSVNRPKTASFLPSPESLFHHNTSRSYQQSTSEGGHCVGHQHRLVGGGESG